MGFFDFLGQSMGPKPAKVTLQGPRYGSDQNTGFIGQLESLQSGQRSPISDAFERMARANAMKSAMATASSTPGVSAGLATRNALRSMEQQNAQINDQSQALRAQQQMAALGQLQSLHQQRAGAELQTSLAQGQLDTQRNMAIAQQPTWGQGLMNAGAQVGAAAIASDKRVKKDVEDADRSIDAFLKKLKPASFKYKEPTAPGRTPGRHTGVMAQDVEKSSAGKGMVSEQGGVKMLDGQKMVEMALASAARLSQRVEQLESALKGRT